MKFQQLFQPFVRQLFNEWIQYKTKRIKIGKRFNIEIVNCIVFVFEQCVNEILLQHSRDMLNQHTYVRHFGILTSSRIWMWIEIYMQKQKCYRTCTMGSLDFHFEFLIQSYRVRGHNISIKMIWENFFEFWILITSLFSLKICVDKFQFK